MHHLSIVLSAFLILGPLCLPGQEARDASQLTLDRIYATAEFRQEYMPPFQWTEGGDAYARVETNPEGLQELVQYQLPDRTREVLIPADDLFPEDRRRPLFIESFTFSEDRSRILIFTNSSRVWRANTKGDYWIYDREIGSLRQIGSSFPASSLMFAKLSADNRQVAYVQGFNLYVEDLGSGEVIPLTNDGGDGIINGTFDWVYEEEFGVRDGFRWNDAGTHLAFWNLDASTIGTFYMINTIDSVYSEPIPLQYPKVGEDPSACRVGVVSPADGQVSWIPVPGSSVQNYLPGMQWLDQERLLIQQMNRHQNKLTVWLYDISSDQLDEVYVEEEDTWVDLQYPDPSASGWGDNALKLVDDNTAFLRLVEDGWRHLYKIDIATGRKTLLTPGDFDVASLLEADGQYVYFHASPDNSTQRYLYRVALDGAGEAERVTPDGFEGMHLYDVAPNGRYAIHRASAAMQPQTVELVALPEHETMERLVDNMAFTDKLNTLDLPEVEFFTVWTEEGQEIDARMIKPPGFDDGKKYPVLFHVYGEPWGQVAVDNWIGLWNIFLAQQGYLIVDMDNRGTPCLKGSNWRKSIYRKIGVLNSRDQAQAARQVLKMPFIDTARTAVWGWSGGGSMTLNLMFRYPDMYKAGMAVASVSNQLIYDNIYQERYMGLPQENRQDFIEGSPITYAKNLKGDLLIVHGTHDDNVHYQSMEMLVDELIRHNKQFRMMAYPNRSHGIYEGQNTRRHLYTLLTDFLMEAVPPGEQ